jgi:hypothetical protein
VLATNDTGFILVPAGAVRPAVVCSGHCIALHRGACRGGLQAWRERRPRLQVPEVLIEASANIVEKAESVCVIAIRHPPAAWGLPLLLLAKEGAVYMRAALFSYVRRRGEQHHGTDGRPGESCSGWGRRGAPCARTGASSRVMA